MLTLIMLAQAVASEPKPVVLPTFPGSYETAAYWQSLEPISVSDAQTLVCRRIGTVRAEFRGSATGVHVVKISGLSHHLSSIERTSIDHALVGIGHLDRVEISCNRSETVLITVSARPTILAETRRVRTLSIVWGRKAMTGVGGLANPVQEVLVEPDTAR